MKYLIEESYEFVHATENDDYPEMEEEMGDVLLQVLLHCTIASEKKKFDLESVSKILADKLVRRHPHVFNAEGEDKINSEQVTKNWENIKAQEGKEKRYIDYELFSRRGVST